MIDPLDGAAFEALLHRSGGDVLLLVDDRLRLRRAGDEAAVLAERRIADLLGMSLIAAFGSAALDTLARQALASGTAVSGEAELGRLGARAFAVDAVPVRGGGIVLSLHDVTALRRMERVRRDFMANISHELRTPLSSIKLIAETLSSGSVDDPATMRDFTTQIEREVDHLAQLVDELLDLSMIESGETELSIAPLAPDDVLAGVAERIGPVAERRTIRVVHRPAVSGAEPGAGAGPGDGAAGGVRAAADRDRLGQALLNMAHNAVKYSHPGGEVRLTWELVDDRVRFKVADDGIGVPDAHKGRIFERFYKADRSRSRDAQQDQRPGSAGLGLAIVRHIAEAHRGAVGFTSDEGVGSTFWIEVPRAG